LENKRVNGEEDIRKWFSIGYHCEHSDAMLDEILLNGFVSK
jgi:hypothetical protein